MPYLLWNEICPLKLYAKIEWAIFLAVDQKISSNLANKIFVPIDKISLSENEDLINAERIGLKYPEE